MSLYETIDNLITKLYRADITDIYRGICLMGCTPFIQYKPTESKYTFSFINPSGEVKFIVDDLDLTKEMDLSVTENTLKLMHKIVDVGLLFRKVMWHMSEPTTNRFFSTSDLLCGSYVVPYNENGLPTVEIWAAVELRVFRILTAPNQHIYRSEAPLDITNHPVTSYALFVLNESAPVVPTYDPTELSPMYTFPAYDIADMMQDIDTATFVMAHRDKFVLTDIIKR